MPVYEKKWWQKLFPKEKEPKEDALKDISAIIEFLGDLNSDVKKLLPALKKLEELEKERLVAHSGLLQVNLETQAKALDKLLERYEFFQNDVDVNGIRLKRVTTEFLRQAKKAGLKDLVKEKQQDPRWRFNW